MQAVSYWPALLAFIVLSLALYAWGRWVARKHGTGPYRLAARAVLVGSIAVIGGAAWALVLLERTQLAAEAGSAAQYADAVGQAFAIAAVPVGVGNLILLASIITLLVGTLRSATPARGPEASE